MLFGNKIEIVEGLAQPFAGYPRYANRDFWGNVDKKAKKYFIEEAEAVLSGEQPLEKPTATEYMRFFRDGNRAEYERKFFAFNRALIALTLAECIGGKGKYLDKIVDVVYEICSMPVWCIPAHNIYYNAEDSLGNVERPFVDLFAAELANTLAHTLYFLEEPLQKISPNLFKLADRELQAQIVKPFLIEDDMWWMGNHGERMNNWSAWIVSNLLCVFTLRTSGAQRKEGHTKCLEILERYFASLSDDGEAEGCGYWNVSAGSIFDCLQFISYATGERVLLDDKEKLQNFLRYIYYTHVQGDYYINVGDNSVQPTVDYDLTYRFACLLEDMQVQTFALNRLYERQEKKQSPSSFENMHRAISYLYAVKGVKGEKTQEKEDVFYEKTKLFLSRSEGENGLVVMAKGGMGENHGHIDAGHFTVYKNKPIFIDVGMITYTKDCFSEKRWDIWACKAEYHNMLSFNQTPMHWHHAMTEVLKKKFGEISSLELDLTKEYAEKAGLLSYMRRYVLDKKKNVFTVEDTACFAKGKNEADYTLMCATRPKFEENGFRIEDCLVTIETDAQCTVTMEEIPLTDNRLASTWGDKIWRLRLHIETNDRLKLILYLQ